MSVDKTYCIFGDSVTQGAYIEKSWVDLLRVYLEKKYRDDFINVFNLGIGGNTTDDIVKRFKFESMMRVPTDIIFAIGVNDSGYFKTSDKPIVPTDRFEKNIRQLINEAKEYTDNITFLGLVLGDDSILKPIPGNLHGESYDYKRVDIYNQKIKEVSEKNNCRFVRLLEKLKSDDFMDGLHPNDQGNKKIFEELKIYFKQL